MERDNRLIGAKWPARPLPGADEPAERSRVLAPRGGRHYARSMTELRRQSTLPIYDSFTCLYAELERRGGQRLRLLPVDLGAAQRHPNVEPERRALGPQVAPRFRDAHALRPGLRRQLEERLSGCSCSSRHHVLCTPRATTKASTDKAVRWCGSAAPHQKHMPISVTLMTSMI